MPETTAKLRAVALAGLMITSVFAGYVALSGTAAAAEINRGSNPVGTWDTADGEGDVGNGGVVFQGEDDISFTWAAEGADSPYQPEALTNTDGNPLSMPVNEDQSRTTYQHDGTDYSVIVRNPRISDYEFRLDSGGDVAGGTVPASRDELTVWADYNFGQAEDLAITVREDGDLDVTNEAIPDRDEQTQSADADGEVTFPVSLANLDSGDYTVELEGVDDLTHDDASVSANVTISGADDATLELEESEVVKGDNVRFDIEGGLEGDYHVVSLDTSDVDGDATDVFRDVGDTVRVDASGGDAWALVEIDGGVGTGSIETAHLDDTSVRVEMSEPVESGHVGEDASPADWDGDTIPNDADDATLTVTEGDISLANPTGTYVPGGEVTVNGTVASAYDEVSVFARDQGEFERVEINNDDTISATDGEFEAEDADLVNDGSGGGNSLLSLPGTYRFAVVAGDAGGVDTMTSSQVVRNVSDLVSLRVAEGDFSVETTLINGQLARGDALEINGTAPGADEINVSFIGPRGTFDQYSAISVDADGTFEAENVRIGNNIRDRFRSEIRNRLVNEFGVGSGDAREVAQQTIRDSFSELSRGQIIMNVGHKGRDGVMGDGTPPDLTREINLQMLDGSTLPYEVEGLPAVIHDINNGVYTQGQVAERLLDLTSQATASDDVSEVFRFQLTEPRTSIDNVVGEAGVNQTVQVGSSISVQGTTNRQPDQNVITVEVVDGPTSDNFAIETTDEWGSDGEWNVTLTSEGFQPGTYTVQASDGESSDVMEFEVTEDNPGSTPTPTPTETPTPEPQTATPTEEPLATATPTETEGDQGPGFGVTMALIAVLAAALLAARRDS